MKRIGVLLAALLLIAIPFYPVTAESAFTGVVTFRSGKNVYLQNGTRGILAFLDSTNDPDQMAAVRVGTVITAFFMGPLIQLFNDRIAKPLLEKAPK